MIEAMLLESKLEKKRKKLSELKYLGLYLKH